MSSATIKGASLAALAAATLAGPAAAQVGADAPDPRVRSEFLGYAVSISPRLIYSDNIFLESKGNENDELIPSLLVSGSVVYASQRLTGIVTGSVDGSWFTQDKDLVLNQDVGAAGTATVVDNLFYVDASASTSRQLVGDQAAFSNNINAARGDRTNVYTATVSPYTLHKFANGSEAELRYRRSQLWVDDDFINDSSSDEGLARLSSGPLFNRLKFAGLAYGRSTRDKGGPGVPDFKFKQATGAGRADFSLTDEFALTGTVGYDEIDTDNANGFFDDDQLSGVFWNAGFIFDPNRRTHLRATYGKRYDDDFIEAEASYQMTPRIGMTAGASRTLQTRATGITSLLDNATANALAYAGQLRDLQASGMTPREIALAAGNYAAVSYGLPSQTVGVGPVDSAYATITANMTRTDLVMSARYDSSNFGFQTIDTVTGQIQLVRRLSRRFQLYSNAVYRYANTDLSPQACLGSIGSFLNDPTLTPAQIATLCADPSNLSRWSNTVSATVGLQYQISRHVAAYGQYIRTNRWADNPLDEYVENAAIVGVRLEY